MKQAFIMLVVLLCSISGWGQKRIFDLYSSQVEKLYGIEVTKPEGFEVLSKETYPLTLLYGERNVLAVCSILGFRGRELSVAVSLFQ